MTTDFGDSIKRAEPRRRDGSRRQREATFRCMDELLTSIVGARHTHPRAAASRCEDGAEPPAALHHPPERLLGLLQREDLDARPDPGEVVGSFDRKCFLNRQPAIRRQKYI